MLSMQLELLVLLASMSCSLLFQHFLVALLHYSQKQHPPTSSLLLFLQESLPALFILEARQII